MNCPVCKYPNASGASHCGMCYEVLNRSAAQTYLIKQKREVRAEREAEGVASSVETPAAPPVDPLSAWVHRIDWTALRQTGMKGLRRLRPFALGALGLLVLWVIISTLISPSLWFHLFGKQITYAMPKPSAYFMVGFTQDIRSWSERQGRLDTPLAKNKWEEIGTVSLEKMKPAAKNRQPFQARVKEWIQIASDPKGSFSHIIPIDHPSLSSLPVTFDKKGALVERKAGTAVRLSKGLVFMYPKFPTGRLRRGQTWTEKVEWTDVYHEWKVHWAGTLSWTLGDMVPCAEGACISLTYRGDLQPSLWSSPSWAMGSVKKIKGQITTEGACMWDAKHNGLLTNLFSYHGLLRIPIDDLVRIPWELRIGRRVKGPGDIVLEFDNIITIRKN